MHGSKRNVLLSLLGIAVVLAAGSLFWFSGRWNRHSPEMTISPNNIYKDTLVVAMDSDYQPYSFYGTDGNPAGYDVELIYKLADEMQMNVEVRLTGWTSAMKLVAEGDAQVLTGLDYNVEALQDYELSMPLDNDPFVAFGTKPVNSVDDLFGKRIATLEGSGSYAAFLTPYQLEAYTTDYPTYLDAFDSVARGENDYAVAMYSVGRRAMAQLDSPDLRAVGPVLAGNYLCIGVKKGNLELKDSINSAIIQLKKEGLLEELGEKWLGRYVEVITLGDYLKQNMLVLIGILAVFAAAGVFYYVMVSRRLMKGIAAQHAATRRVLEYQQLLTEATKGLYESIYELDMTNNCAVGDVTKQFFESMGIPGDSPIECAVNTIAQKQIKEEFINEYLQMFSPEHVLSSYREGIDRFSYDFLITSDGECYYWVRITARIFFWNEDSSVHMIVYRQNIDAEKRRELIMEEKMQEDSLTGLYNKRITEGLIRQKLEKVPERPCAFLMIDIDRFKTVNDTLGHAFGDYVIVEFARELKSQAKEGAIVGRVGGDEFVVFLDMESREWLKERVTDLIRGLCREIRIGDKGCRITTSIGIALYPDHGMEFDSLYQNADSALYETKNRGRNGYTIYEDGKRDEMQGCAEE